eukprot:757613-Hanusia_phi.AAC.6
MTTRDYSLFLVILVPFFGTSCLSPPITIPLCLRVRGGNFEYQLSLRDSGRVADLWDFHFLTTRSCGDVILFRHRVSTVCVDESSDVSGCMSGFGDSAGDQHPLNPVS